MSSFGEEFERLLGGLLAEGQQARLLSYPPGVITKTKTQLQPALSSHSDTRSLAES